MRTPLQEENREEVPLGRAGSDVNIERGILLRNMPCVARARSAIASDNRFTVRALA